MCVGVCVIVMYASFLTIVLIWTSSLSIKYLFINYLLVTIDRIDRIVSAFIERFENILGKLSLFLIITIIIITVFI